MYPIVADGGELTVLSPVASHTWGTWRVEWPESVPDNVRDDPPEGKELGYVSKLPDAPEGMMGRRFVRADVAVTASEYTEAGKPIAYTGVSNVETVLDHAAGRTKGGVFLEKDIATANLAGCVPGVDFQLGDVVPVEIWGKRTTLPVTRIEALTELGETIGWSVHLGGELIDDAAREKGLFDLERTIAKERRERKSDVAKATATANEAKDSADAARREVATARTDAADAKDAAGRAVVDTAVEYAPSTSRVEAPTSGWSQAYPGDEGGELWQRSVTWFGDGRVERSTPVLVTGRNGAQGPKGEKGEDGGRIYDTRHDNQTPEWYIKNYPQATVKEFKEQRVVGLPGGANYTTVETTVPWRDSSGGPVEQTAQVDGKLYLRRSISNTAWSAWEEKGLKGDRGPQGPKGATGDAPTIGATSYTSPQKKAELRIGGKVVDTLTGRGHALWVVDPATGEIMGKKMVDTCVGGVTITDAFTDITSALPNAGIGSVVVTAVADAGGLGDRDRDMLKYFGIDAPAYSPGKNPHVMVGQYYDSQGVSILNPGQGYSKAGRVGDGQVLTLDVPWTQEGIVFNGAQGPKGDQGPKGNTGSRGVSTTSVTHFWRWAGAKPGTPTGTGNPSGWSTSQPAYQVGQKLWVTIRTLFSNGAASWSPVTEEASVSAATAISAEAANTKNRVWYAASAPGSTRGEREGDTWFQYSGNTIVGQWRWTGSSWATQKIGDQVIANLDAGKITAGTIDARRIGAGSIDASKIKADSITVRELRAGTIVPIGASLIVFEPPTSGATPEPIWWQQPGLGTVIDGATGNYAAPLGNRYKHSSGGTTAPPMRLVKVQPGKKYRLRFWTWAVMSGSRLFIEMRDKDGAHAVKSGTVTGYVTPKKETGNWGGWAGPRWDYTGSARGTYLVENLEVPTVPTLIESIIEFKPEIEWVKLAKFYWNHPNGVKTVQYLAGLTLDLDVVDQAQIDALQNKQIEDNKAIIKRLDYLSTSILAVAHDEWCTDRELGYGVIMPRNNRYMVLLRTKKFKESLQSINAMVFYSNKVKHYCMGYYREGIPGNSGPAWGPVRLGGVIDVDQNALDFVQRELGTTDLEMAHFFVDLGNVESAIILAGA